MNRIITILSTSLLIILLLLLLSIIIIATERISAAEIYLADCNNCLSIRVLPRTAACCLDTAIFNSACSAETAADGTTGIPIVIRTQQLLNLVDANDNGRTVYIGATDVATEGTWKWMATDETFWISGTGTFRFAFKAGNWGAGEPNNFFANGRYENMAEQSGTSWNDEDGSRRDQIVCMFVHKQSKELKTPSTATASMTTYGVYLDYTVYEAEVFSAHVNHNTANTKCRALSRTDPLTGLTIQGQLAIVRSPAQDTLLYDLIFSNSDIHWHTTEAGFGVWMAGTRTDNPAKTMGYPLAVQSSNSNAFVGSSCDSLNYCNFSAGAVASTWAVLSSQAKLVQESDPTWIMQDRDYTMPYACSFEYSLTSTINATIVDSTLQNSLTDIEMSRFISFGDHLTWEEARDKCEALTMSNSNSESVTGELAAVFSDQSNAALKALAEAAQVEGRFTSDEGGFWIGLSTEITAAADSTSCDLRWNTSASIMPPGSTKARVATCDGSTSACETGKFCSMTATTLTSSWPVAEARGVVIGIKRSPVNWVTHAITKTFPFVCSFRYTYRDNITEHLAGEIHTTPRSYSDAGSYCGTRSVGQAGNLKIGGLFEWRRGGWGKIVEFATKHPDNENAVWIGNRHPSDATQCLAVHPKTNTLQYFDCSTPLPHVCIFVLSIPTTRTTSKTRTDPPTNTSSESVSFTSSPEATNSTSISQSHSDESSSQTDVLTETKTSSSSLTNKSSLSLTESETLTRSVTIPPTPTQNVTKSKSDSVSESSPPTLTVKTLSETGTNESTETQSNSTILTVSATLTANTLSQELSDSQEKTDTGNASHTRTEPTLSETFTIHIPVIPVKATPLSETIGTAATAIGLANPAVASAMARISAAKSLAECGQGTDIDDVPARFESPFLWTIGTNKFRYQRGIIAGCGVLMLIIIAANFILGAGLGQAFLKNWREGALRMRFPSLVMLPFLIFHVPVATAASILALYGNGNDVVAAFIGGTLLLCIPMIFAGEVARRLRKGQCTLVKVNLNTKERRASKRKWKKYFGAHTVNFFSWLMVYPFQWRDTAVLRYERDLENRIKQGDKAAKKELKKFNIEKNNENSRYPFFGRWGEFFDDVSLEWFFLADFIVATIQGFSAGAAAQETTRTICFVSLTSALLSCVAHTAIVLIKRPGISRIFQGYLAISSIVTLSAFMLAYVKFIMRDQFDYDEPAETVGLIQAICGMLISVVSLGEFFDFLHGLVDSLCCNKTKYMSSSDEEEMVKDEAPTIAIEEEPEEAEAAQCEPSEVDKEEQFAMEMMENAKQLLMKQANGTARNDDDDEDDDFTGLDERQKAFKLFRLLSSDDPIFESLKTPQQIEEAKRKKERDDEKMKKRAEKRRLRELGIVEEDNNADDNNKSKENEAPSSSIEKDVAQFATTSALEKDIKMATSPKSGKAIPFNFDSDLDNDDNNNNNNSNNVSTTESSSNNKDNNSDSTKGAVSVLDANEKSINNFHFNNSTAFDQLQLGDIDENNNNNDPMKVEVNRERMDFDSDLDNEVDENISHSVKIALQEENMEFDSDLDNDVNEDISLSVRHALQELNEFEQQQRMDDEAAANNNTNNNSAAQNSNPFLAASSDATMPMSFEDL